MRLETQNLLENYRNSCYLECDSFFGPNAGWGSLRTLPGVWAGRRRVLPKNRIVTNPTTEVARS